MVGVRNSIVILSVLCTLLFFVSAGCLRRSEPETVLIPKGYIGEIAIVFDQDGSRKTFVGFDGDTVTYISALGNPREYESGRRKYVIPKDGILLTQFDFEAGFYDIEYYYVDSNGQREQIPVYRKEMSSDAKALSHLETSKDVLVFGDGTSGSFPNSHVKTKLIKVADYSTVTAWSREFRRSSLFDSAIRAKIGLPR